MSLALVLFALASVETAAQFQKENPALSAAVSLTSNGSWHLGGFCFGMAPDGESVGQLVVTAHWNGQTALRDNGPVYLVGFDGRAERWGEASQQWDSSSCTEKMLKATSVSNLDSRGNKHSFIIDMFQVHDIRDWHFAVLACGSAESAMLELKVEATHGALSVFPAGTFIDSSSCPVERSDWLQQAGSKVPFWVLLVAAAAAGACCTLGVTFACRPKSSQKPGESVHLDTVVGKVHTDPSADAAGTDAKAAAKVPDETLLV
eukprot:CAMPEP_0181422790 /NCGR_PEP_ID=MMETSP1110-20121109/13795_1 /TAXON_ID=174948 /ORGANISM="Symbiodinium sp., Strain CCMP421" /LENGTH=260 /DNA_ID=CAMNT_0023545897 /DNA_START=69 /DNA_END=851 /DNA_ORIENTATION=-